MIYTHLGTYLGTAGAYLPPGTPGSSCRGYTRKNFAVAKSALEVSPGPLEVCKFYSPPEETFGTMDISSPDVYSKVVLSSREVFARSLSRSIQSLQTPPTYLPRLFQGDHVYHADTPVHVLVLVTSDVAVPRWRSHSFSLSPNPKSTFTCPMCRGETKLPASGDRFKPPPELTIVSYDPLHRRGAWRLAVAEGGKTCSAPTG